MKRHAARFNPFVTEKIIEIFGADLIDKVFITTYIGYKDELAEVKQNLEDQIWATPAKLDASSDLSYDSEAFIIQFKNGKQVVFSNSEWGYIEPVSLDDFELIEGDE